MTVAAEGSDIVTKLLDWPFLAFLAIVALGVLFAKPVRAALLKGSFTLSWGEDRSITLNQLSGSLTAELDPIRDDIEGLRKDIADLKRAAAPAGTPPPEQVLGPDRQDRARTKMREALDNDQYQWRSVERLAIIAGITELQAREILSADPLVQLGRGKSGRDIARLKSRNTEPAAPGE